MSEQEATNPQGGVAEAPEAPAQEHIPETNTETPELAEGEHAEAAVEDLEDIEFEGKQFRGPKEIKEALLRHGDYTQKTQKLADERKALEARNAQIQHAETLQREHLESLAELRTIDKQIDRYQKYDWNAAFAQVQGNQQATDELNAHWRQFQLLQGERNKAVNDLTQKERERASIAEREHATRVEKAAAAIRSAVPNWSPEVDQQLGKFVADHGLTPAEVFGAVANNPKIAKILHLAMQQEQSLTKARAAAKPAAPVAIPVPTVSARQSPRVDPNPSDKDTPEEWLRKREAQIKRSR